MTFVAKPETRMKAIAGRESEPASDIGHILEPESASAKMTVSHTNSRYYGPTPYSVIHPGAFKNRYGKSAFCGFKNRFNLEISYGPSGAQPYRKPSNEKKHRILPPCLAILHEIFPLPSLPQLGRVFL